MQDSNLSLFEDLLKRLHQEHVEKRKRLEESRQNLSENQIEFEENAANAQMATPLEQLDDQEEDRLVAIERALDRLRTGLYGTCESCGAAISTKRLKDRTTKRRTWRKKKPLR